MRYVPALLCSYAVAACGDDAAAPVAKPQPAGPIPCERIAAAALGLDRTTLSVTELVQRGSLQAPGLPTPFENLPVFCRVAGTVEAAIEFEVWLPTDTYNKRLLAVGNGAMAGAIGYAAMSVGLGGGYAVVSTDTGHRVKGPFDASWALDRPDLIEDFGHRALHVATVNAKKIAAAFYGAAPAHAYYTGCSKGGQQGLMEAQRYPEDFDGIVAGNPAHDWTRFYAGGHLWYALATLGEPDSYVQASKLPLITRAVNVACDALDGVEDGILNDPRDCSFDPATLSCAAGQDPATCLTGPQVDAMKKIYAGATSSGGMKIFPGLRPGSEEAGLDGWLTGSAPFEGLHYAAANDFFRYMVFDDPAWDFRTFDFDRDLPIALGKVAGALDANNPDLAAFRDRGGKLLVYHGWSDPDIAPETSIDYCDAVASRLGGPDALAGWYRLFMAPGVGHCVGGPGPDGFATLPVMEAWVEDGIAPDRIVASKTQGGSVVRSRPLCAYPKSARWKGSGSTDVADSFECVEQ